MYILPLKAGYRVTQTFWTPWFFNSTVFHRGIDYAVAAGRSISPVADGNVIREGYRKDYGYFAEIGHGDGLTSLYAHMQNRSFFNYGDKVHTKDQIGRVGSTGLSSGPHLHFEMRKNNRKVNPSSFDFISREDYMELDKFYQDVKELKTKVEEQEEMILALSSIVSGKASKKQLKQLSDNMSSEIVKRIKGRIRPKRLRKAIKAISKDAYKIYWRKEKKIARKAKKKNKKNKKK